MTTDSATNPHRIETQGLVKNFGQRAVVNGVDLQVNAGEIVGLLGPNGAGKTTTFYMVVGLVAATSGKVLINGKDATKLKMHQRARLGLGYLPQEPSTFRKLTVAQNLLAECALLLKRLTTQPLPDRLTSCEIRLR